MVTAHNLEHVVEDILRFSSSDNYWCGVETDCLCFSHLWMPFANHDGILYRAGETVIIADNNGVDVENVACVDAFICAVVDDQFHSLWRGSLYPAMKDDAGMPEIYCYNFGKLVVPSVQQLVVPTERILRKVFLYPDPENMDNPTHYVVIDHMRKDLPVSCDTVNIPFYPQLDDVVVVGCADGENYISPICSLQCPRGTKQSNFIIMLKTNKGLDAMSGKALGAAHYRQ